MKIDKMFKAHEERGQCMKGSGSLNDAQPSYEMDFFKEFEQILTFFED